TPSYPGAPGDEPFARRTSHVDEPLARRTSDVASLATARDKGSQPESGRRHRFGDHPRSRYPGSVVWSPASRSLATDDAQNDRREWSFRMAAVGDICGKGPGFGKSVSHSHRRTSRRWDPNIQTVRAVTRPGGNKQRLNVCTSCL